MNNHGFLRQRVALPIGRALKNLKTGKLGPSAKIYKQDYPYRFPAGNPFVWRYMRIDHFKDLCERGLYLARVDKFIDPMEGLPSHPVLHGTSRSDLEFRRLYKIEDKYDELLASYKTNRQRVFCSCWHLNRRESRLMWRDRMTSDSVAVATRLDDLKAFICGDVMVSMVKYLKEDEPRTELDLQSFLFFKDKRKYEYEREIRVVLPVWNGPVADTDVGRTLSLRPSVFVKRLVTHPFISPDGFRWLEEVAMHSVPQVAVEPSHLGTADRKWLKAHSGA